MLVILLIVFILFILVLIEYNNLVKLKNRIKDQYAQIDVLLKNRANLVPDLVEIIKGYNMHEEKVLEDAVLARKQVISSKSITSLDTNDDRLVKDVNQIIGLKEAYPDLKANELFLDLQKQLSELEDKIAMARHFYNEVVLKYNNHISMFPTNFIALIFKFKKQDYFGILDKEREVVKVEL